MEHTTLIGDKGITEFLTSPLWAGEFILNFDDLGEWLASIKRIAYASAVAPDRHDVALHGMVARAIHYVENSPYIPWIWRVMACTMLSYQLSRLSDGAYTYTVTPLRITRRAA